MPLERTIAPARRARGEVAFPMGPRWRARRIGSGHAATSKPGSTSSSSAAGPRTSSWIEPFAPYWPRCWPEGARGGLRCIQTATYSVSSIGDEISLALHSRAGPAPEGIDATFAAVIVVAHDLKSPATVRRTIRIVVRVAEEALVQVDATHGDTAFARVSRIADDPIPVAYPRSPVDPGGEAVEVPGEAHVFAVAGPDGYQYPEGPVCLVLAREGHGPASVRRIDRVTPLQWVIDRVHAVGVVGLVAPSQAEVAVGKLAPVVRLADDRVTRRDTVAGAAIRVPPMLRLHEEVGVREVASPFNQPLPAGGRGAKGGVLHLPFCEALLLRRASKVRR